MAESIMTAIRHHQGGRIDQAELIYRQILDEDPYHADALHLLGVVNHQRGRHQRAVEMITKAISLKPDVATYHGNIAEAFRMSGNLPKALEHCQTALKLDPNSADIHNNAGLILLALGRREEAAQHLQKAVQIKPEFALAFNNLGNALRELGKIEEAIGAYRDSVKIAPDMPQSHCNLGQILLERGQIDEALHHCQEAVRLKSDFPEALNNLGNVLRQQNKLDEAKNYYAKAISLNPRLGMAYNNMGQALQEEGKYDEAMSWYQQALLHEPRLARIHCNLASLLYAQGKEDDAIARYQLAVQMQPDYPEAHIGLGQIKHEQGDLHGAAQCYREALRLRPDSASSLSSLGQVLEELGEIDEAVAHFRSALKFDPMHTGALGSLATILRDKLPPEEEKHLADMMARTDLSDSRRSALMFGMAHVLDARKDYAKAGEHIRQANDLRWKSWIQLGQTYSAEENTRFVNKLIENFNDDFFNRIKGMGSDSERPIFIVGMPRSGTTLTEQVLASHPKVYGAGELRFAKDAFDSLARVVEFAAEPVACLPKLNQDNLRKLADRHLEKLDRINMDKIRVVDKMPDNYLYVGLLAAMFPKAKFIHCRRDVRDVAVSCWITNFRVIRWATSLEHLAMRINNYFRLMEHWRKVLPVKLLEVDYQETVEDLEKIAKQLIQHAGLEWDPACLAFHETKRPVLTASLTQVRKPIYKTSLERWRNYEDDLKTLIEKLDPAVTASFEKGKKRK